MNSKSASHVLSIRVFIVTSVVYFYCGFVLLTAFVVPFLFENCSSYGKIRIETCHFIKGMSVRFDLTGNPHLYSPLAVSEPPALEDSLSRSPYRLGV